MHRNTKVATCSYCGTRAALVLDAGRHELVCRACGAPLHELKAMPLPKGKYGKPREITEARPTSRRPDHEHAWRSERKKKKSKKRKSFKKKMFEEAFDFLEDIFD
ncbi:MAG: hypothetical protein AAGJ91_12480 [Pseudomonadota bacterium]